MGLFLTVVGSVEEVSGFFNTSPRELRADACINLLRVNIIYSTMFVMR